MHTVKWLHVWYLTFIKYYYVKWIICSLSNDFKWLIIIIFYKWLNSSIWLIYGTLTGTTTFSHSGHRSNGNEGALHVLPFSGTETSPSNARFCYIHVIWGILSLCRGTIVMLCYLSWQVSQKIRLFLPTEAIHYLELTYTWAKKPLKRLHHNLDDKFAWSNFTINFSIKLSTSKHYKILIKNNTT